MTEQSNPEEQLHDVPTANGFDPQPVVDVLTELVETARVESAFGEPITASGRTVIPVADVVLGLGFGMGMGQATSPSPSVGGGSGAGGGARSRPVATVVVDEQGVRVMPILDVTRLGLAGMATGGFLLIWLFRLLRTGRALEKSDVKALPTAREIKRLAGRLG